MTTIMQQTAQHAADNLPLILNVCSLLAIGAGSAVYVERSVSAMRKDFTDFKENLPKYLNGTYRRSEACTLIEKAVSQRLDATDATVRELAHEMHAMTGGD